MRHTMRDLLVGGCSLHRQPRGSMRSGFGIRRQAFPVSRDGKPNLFAPAPRIGGDKLDLSGLWGPDTKSGFFDISEGEVTGAADELHAPHLVDVKVARILGNRLLSSGSTCAGRRIALRVAAAVLGHLRVRRVDSVTTQYRSFLLASLLSAVLLVSAFAVVQAQNAGSPAASRWSDPSTWPDKKVPAKDAIVTIEKDMNVILDVSPPPLHGIKLNGTLSFADNKDLELTTEWIMVHGELEIGTEARPHTRNATITLTDNVKGEDFGGMGGNDRSDRGIMLMGGILNLHGPEKNTWTKLAKTAEAGSNSIEVLNAADWRAGEEIVLASTDFDPRQAERRTISAIRGNAITLDKKLDYMHFGKITFDVDE